MAHPYYTWSKNPTILKPPPVGFGVNPRWVIASNQDGHLESFALGGDGAVWHSWQNYLNIYQWSEWATLGTPATVATNPYSMRAIQNEDGRVEVFIADEDWNVWHIWQVAPNANWIGAWSNLERPISPQSSNDDYSMAVCLGDGGQIVVLMQDSDTGEIFSRSQSSPNGNWEPAWTTLGQVPANLGDFTAQAAPRSLFTQAIAILPSLFGGSSSVYVNQRSNFVAGQTQWSGWNNPLAGPANVASLRSPVLQANQDTHLELMALDSTGNLWHTWQDDKDNWNQPWSNFGPPPQGGLGTYASSLGLGGLISIISWGGDNALHVVTQTVPSSGWGAWGLLWQNPDPDPIQAVGLQLIADQDGLLNAFGQDSAGGLFYIRQIYHRSVGQHLTNRVKDFWRKIWNPDGKSDMTRNVSVFVDYPAHFFLRNRYMVRSAHFVGEIARERESKFTCGRK